MGNPSIVRRPYPTPLRQLLRGRALRSGKGKVFRRYDGRRLFLSVLPLLRDNTWEVRFTPTSSNLADRPSREILLTLHRAADSQQGLRRSRHYGDWTEY